MGWHVKSTFVPLEGGLPALRVLHPAVNLDKGSPNPPPYPTPTCHSAESYLMPKHRICPP